MNLTLSFALSTDNSNTTAPPFQPIFSDVTAINQFQPSNSPSQHKVLFNQSLFCPIALLSETSSLNSFLRSRLRVWRRSVLSVVAAHHAACPKADLTACPQLKVEELLMAEGTGKRNAARKVVHQKGHAKAKKT